MKNWNQKEENALIEMMKNGSSYEEVSVLLNRTARSIREKSRKLKVNVNSIKDIELICLECGEKFKISQYNKKDENRKFCSKSCSAKFNNKKRKIKKFCVNCECELDYQKKYCSNKCQGEYKTKKIYEKIESGDTSLHEKTYRNYLIYKHGAICMKCGWSEINPITGCVPIQMEHIDGNSENHNLNNLKLLCPNCHSLTPTFGALNKGFGRKNRYKKADVA